jgi:NTP pyrophosphatase (non-canonical NTP hydrolase)
MHLDDYQREANLTDQRSGRDEEALVFPLLGLASEVGSLVNQYKRRVRDGEAHALFSERVAEELGDVMWYVANLAGKLDFSLETIANLNLRRIRERWPIPDAPAPSRFLDEDFPEGERLPRLMSVRFVETEEEGRPRVRIWSADEMLGDPLSDMAWEDDAYRFHDAFHLTYAALLGWSPITRAFFNRQRESNPLLREIEDSGRAKVIEEAISAIVFEYARKASFLEGVEHVDFTLLQTIKEMVSGLEVRIRTARDWEHAILRSYEVWRELRYHHGGSVHIDLVARSIEFEPA